MKKTLVILVLCIAVCLPSAFAVQKDKSVTINPFGTLFGRLIEANISVTPNISVPVGGSFLSYETGDDEFSFLKLGTGVRYYFKGNAINGLYVGGLLDYYRISAEQTSVLGSLEYTGKESASAIGFGGLIGFQSVWDSGLTLDTGIGIQSVSISDIDVELENSAGAKLDSSIDGISLSIPLIQLAIGYAF